jgi:hypothetical protein
MSDIHDLIDKELAKANKAFEKDIRDLYLAAERAESASKTLREKAQAIVQRLNGDAPQANGSTPPAKAKRKPVAVTNEQLERIEPVLKASDGSSPREKRRRPHAGDSAPWRSPPWRMERSNDTGVYSGAVGADRLWLSICGSRLPTGTMPRANLRPR